MGTQENIGAAAPAVGGRGEENISTEHQPKGAARNPSDTLDREGAEVENGRGQWNEDSAVKPGDSGEA